MNIRLQVRTIVIVLLALLLPLGSVAQAVAPVSADIQVDVAGAQWCFDIARSTQNGFAVVWQNGSIFLRFISARGETIGSALPVIQDGGAPACPHLDATPAGDMVLGWDGWATGFNEPGFYVQRLNPNGTLKGQPIQVVGHEAWPIKYADLAVAHNGNLPSPG